MHGERTQKGENESKQFERLKLKSMLNMNLAINYLLQETGAC